MASKTEEIKSDIIDRDLLELSKIHTCIFCGSSDIKVRKSEFVPFLTERMFMSKPQSTFMVHCNNCHINYSSYRPTNEEMARLYAGYRGEEYQKQRQKFEPSYTKEYNYDLGHNPINVISRRNFLDTILYKYICPEKITKVLDYGGDNGQFIPNSFLNAQKFVYEVSNVPTIDGVKNISKDEIMSNPDFDFVMCCHVLEHVSNPIEIINELLSYCKNGGYIYLEVPYEPQFLDNNYIHEHISSFSEETFFKLWDILDDVDIIDSRTYMGRTYAIIRKNKILKSTKILKKSIKMLKAVIRKTFRIYSELKRKLNILYLLSR